MDPNTALASMRDAIKAFQLACDGGSDDAEHDAAIEVAAYAGALDEWLTNGGFMPDAWQANPKA